MPDHPGAIHYLIHSYDFPALATRGVPAAKRYAAVAPSAPHALHMPSHIYSMLGMWEESIKANQDALWSSKATFTPSTSWCTRTFRWVRSARPCVCWKPARSCIGSPATAAARTPTGGVFPTYTAYAAIPARYAIERSAVGRSGGAGTEAARPRPPMRSPISRAPWAPRGCAIPPVHAKRLTPWRNFGGIAGAEGPVLGGAGGHPAEGGNGLDRTAGKAREQKL